MGLCARLGEWHTAGMAGGGRVVVVAGVGGWGVSWRWSGGGRMIIWIPPERETRSSVRNYKVVSELACRTGTNTHDHTFIQYGSLRVRPYLILV